MMSLHKNYADFSDFVAEQLQYWGEDVQDYDTMLISLRGIIVKPFSLACLAEPKETS